MQKKVILLATFITNEYLDKFLYKLYKQFGVKKQSVFLFETKDKEIILTYRLFLNFDEKINIRKELPKKGTTFFTINSLNRLIEKEYDLPKGNTDYSRYEIDWSKYENTMISLRNNNLEILDLNKKIIG